MDCGRGTQGVAGGWWAVAFTCHDAKYLAPSRIPYYLPTQLTYLMGDF